MEIRINNAVSIEIADTYLYRIKREGYPYPIMWSEEYAKERNGKHTWLDDKCSFFFTESDTKKIYKAIKAIKALAECGEFVN